MQGNHVLLREFEFVNMTPRNRLAFVRLVVESYRNAPQGMCGESYLFSRLVAFSSPPPPPTVASRHHH